MQALKHELTTLRNAVNFGDPFIIQQTFGKGKVVAIMSTVGKDWNDWCGGCALPGRRPAAMTTKHGG